MKSLHIHLRQQSLPSQLSLFAELSSVSRKCVPDFDI